MHLRYLALIAAILPFVAIYGSYMINAWLEVVPWCFPNIEGCVSVSRGARKGDGIFLFKAIMMPYSVVLIVFWSVARKWLRALGDTDTVRLNAMITVGTIGAIALLLYTDFLGTKGDAYRFMRRFGIIFFFCFTGLAEFLFTSRLYALKNPVVNSFKFARSWMLVVCYLQLILGLTHLYLSTLVEDGYILESANEWNFGVLLMLFSIGCYFAWKKTDINWSISISS